MLDAVLVDGVMVLGKELRRHPERALRELRARAAAASVALRGGAREVLTLEARLRGQARSGSEIVVGLLDELGVPLERVVVGDRTRSTREEALAAAELARARGYARLVAITSAYHVPRARRTFHEVFEALCPERRCEVVAPEGFLQGADPREREWILAGTPDAACEREERPTELAFGGMAAALRPLPPRLRWDLEVKAGAWWRRVNGP